MYAGKIVESGTVASVFARPAHEYTKGLLGSIPVHDRKGSPLANIPGKVPSIEERQPGCPFAPRCGKALAVCRESFPNGTALGDGHTVYCVLAEDNQ
jgi:peptide/nickel transport system ATP-binding protein